MSDLGGVGKAVGRSVLVGCGAGVFVEDSNVGNGELVASGGVIETGWQAAIVNKKIPVSQQKPFVFDNI